MFRIKFDTNPYNVTNWKIKKKIRYAQCHFQYNRNVYLKFSWIDCYRPESKKTLSFSLSLNAAGSDRSRVVTSKSHRRRVRDHLAAGVEKESREIRLRNGRSLPTAVQLIAKINIHYCNYFLRRGRAVSHDEGRREGNEGDRRRRRLEEGGRGVRKNEEDAPTSCNLSPTAVHVHIYIHISVTRVSLTWSSSCPWRVNYKVEPTIPSLAKRNRWIQLAWVGARRILVCIRSNHSPGRCVFMRHGWKKDSIRAGPLWLICFRPSASLQEILRFQL